MDIEVINIIKELIGSVGFPIFCAIYMMYLYREQSKTLTDLKVVLEGIKEQLKN